MSHRVGFEALHVYGRLFPGGVQSTMEAHPLSHIVQIQTEVRDPVAVTAACRRLGFPEPITGTDRPFSDTAAPNALSQF